MKILINTAAQNDLYTYTGMEVNRDETQIQRANYFSVKH
jgi:hypothetical protein